MTTVPPDYAPLKHEVYIVYGLNGECLYAGMTWCFEERLYLHQISWKHHWPHGDYSHIDVTQVASRGQAREGEAWAIWLLQPTENKNGKKRPPTYVAPPVMPVEEWEAA